MFVYKFNVTPPDDICDLHVVIYFETTDGKRYWGVWRSPTPERFREVVEVLCICDDELEIDYELADDHPGEERTSLGLSVADSLKLGVDVSEPFKRVFITDVRDCFQRD